MREGSRKICGVGNGWWTKLLGFEIVLMATIYSSWGNAKHTCLTTTAENGPCTIT